MFLSEMVLALAFASRVGTPGTTTLATVPANCDHARTVRVLFVGNSYTYVNNVPHLVEAMAAGLHGPCVESTMIASGGATLRDHWNADSVMRRIRNEKWTAVVLQDQSSFGEQWSVDGRPRLGESGAELAEFASRFADVIKSVKAKPILLAHWSDDGAPARDQQFLDYTFANAARTTGSTLAPVGEAIQRMRASVPGVTPYVDGAHLSEAGSYLEALVLYATLTDRSPIGAVRRINGPAVEFARGVVFPDSLITLVDIPDSVAALLQGIAAAVHSERSGQSPSARKPASLSDEFPKLSAHGDRLTRETLAGRWRGTSTVLPTPGHEPMQVELVLQSETEHGSTPDSVYLRGGRLEIAGSVSVALADSLAVLRGTVTPRSRIGRAGPPAPFSIELRVVRSAEVISGVATMHQEGSPSMPSYDAVGRLELKRYEGAAGAPPL